MLPFLFGATPTMQKPLITEAMMDELEAQVAKVTPAEEIPFAPRPRRSNQHPPQFVPDPLPEPQPVEELTSDRRQTHGNFRDNARLSQMLKAVFRATASWDHLDDVEKESLDMIALKISRVLSGKSLEKQHWEDIEGYAHLVLKECQL